ncbi:MAG TPA: hypothetical protein ENK23_04960 [Sorangium sp.]|nr:hypothetical protein [Sorangium sp.]
MDLQRLLHKCHRDQWHIDDLDWSAPARAMPAAKEQAVVQYFTDMAGIERLAGALFAEQRRHETNPVLREIFTTFIGDEERHAQVAQRLADHYNRHHYRTYTQNPNLARFRPHFLNTVRSVAPDVGNTYIITGELLLDIALLRSLDDYVDDHMSHAAMRLINRDESRHIAIDYYMVGYYCSDAYVQQLKHTPAKPFTARLTAYRTFALMLFYAGPFIREVFFEPMDLTDPSGKRMYQAFKRIQLLSRKPEVARRPFARYLRSLQVLFNNPVVGGLFGPLLSRLAGLDPRVLVELYNEAEERRAATMTMDELAAEALEDKHRQG